MVDIVLLFGLCVALHVLSLRRPLLCRELINIFAMSYFEN